jgi:ferredoxin
MAYRDQLADEFGPRCQFYFSRTPGGRRIDLPAILAQAPADALFYVCGPNALLDAVTDEAARLGVAAERIRFERFAAPDSAPAARAFSVTLGESGKTLAVPADRSLLDVLLAAGVAAPFGCRAGQCGTCAVRVIEGAAEHRDVALSAAEKAAGATMCTCVSRAAGDHLKLAL